MQRLIFGILTLGLLMQGCDDDDDDMDAGPADSGVVDAGGDAGPTDAGGDAGADAGGDAGADAGADADVDAGGDAGPGDETFTVALTTADEVPVCTAAGADAAGSATVMVDAASSMIVVTDLTFEDLSGAAMAAHIHLGEAGVAGPVVLTFDAPLTSPLDQTFTAADYPATPPAGAPADFEGFVELVRAGETYINVHTPACMPGEIRAQIE